MALIFFSGFETGDFGEWGSVTNSPTIDEAIPKTGDYCMRCNTDATTAYVDSGGTYRHRASFYLYITSAPDGECLICGSIASLRHNIRLTADRYLKLYNNVTLVGTSTTQLGVGTWYRISKGSHSLYINGSVEVTDTSGLAMEPYLGIQTSCSADLYFDDYIQDDTTSVDDLGDIRVLRSSPNAAGQYAQFDTVSGYTYCDEVPADGATTIVDDSGVSSIHRETYNLQDYDTIGIGASDTWLAVNIWVQGYDSGNTAQGITVRDDGTDYETLAEWGKAYGWKNKLYVGDAPRASAWTKEIFDAFQAGCYSEGSKDVYVSCVMVMVAYIPAAVGGWTHKFLGVANAAIGKINGVAIADILKVNNVE